MRRNIEDDPTIEVLCYDPKDQGLKSKLTEILQGLNCNVRAANDFLALVDEADQIPGKAVLYLGDEMNEGVYTYLEEQAVIDHYDGTIVITNQIEGSRREEYGSIIGENKLSRPAVVEHLRKMTLLGALNHGQITFADFENREKEA